MKFWSFAVVSALVLFLPSHQSSLAARAPAPSVADTSWGIGATEFAKVGKVKGEQPLALLLDFSLGGSFVIRDEVGVYPGSWTQQGGKIKLAFFADALQQIADNIAAAAPAGTVVTVQGLKGSCTLKDGVLKLTLSYKGQAFLEGRTVRFSSKIKGAGLETGVGGGGASGGSALEESLGALARETGRRLGGT